MTRLQRLVVILASCSLVACLPTRRENDPKPDVVVTDAGELDAGGVNTADSAEGDSTENDGQTQDSGPEDTASADVPIPEGCKADSACAALVPSACHVATCNATSGLCEVKTLADGADCGSGNKCLSSATCESGKCIGVAIDCDDKDVCTTDTCNKISGCIYDFNTSVCNDGDPCTQNDKCDQGACKAKPRQCIPAGGPCAKTACVAAKGGCVLIPQKLEKGKTCSDGKPCTMKDDCVDGKCVGTAMVCNQDNNPCTANACAIVAGKGVCKSKGVGLVACDDGNPCTEMDRCEPTQKDPNQYFCQGSAKSCDDDNPCTNDACKDGKCENKADNAGKCSDDDNCTVEDTCKDGKCLKGKARNCDDGNLCTTDSCDTKLGGCGHASNTVPCSDGDVCTEKDTCAKASCSGTNVVCDDGNPCTADTCAEGQGCVASTVKNGTSCSGGGQCWGGDCVVPKCGNTICEFNEDVKKCVADCPAGGGLCKQSDTKCVDSCRTDRCATAVKGCSDEKACTVLLSCLDKCTNDGCRLGCVKVATAKAVTAYYALTYCLSTKCLQNSWNGKQCKTTVTSYPACIKACQNGVCTAEEIVCYGSSACAKMAKCVDSCALNDATCPPKCIKAGTKPAQDAYLALEGCVTAKCL